MGWVRAPGEVLLCGFVVAALGGDGFGRCLTAVERLMYRWWGEFVWFMSQSAAR